MGKHAKHRMAGTSIGALRQHEERLKGRACAVLDIFRAAPFGLTARECLERICIREGAHRMSREMNYVRPRITELSDLGLLVPRDAKREDMVSGVPVTVWMHWTHAPIPEPMPEPRQPARIQRVSLCQAQLALAM